MGASTGTGSAPPAGALELRGVSKSFGSAEVLHAVDLTVAAGSIHGLLGANGAGKSTLIKILSGIHAADRGTLTVRSSRGVAASIGFIHQDLGIVDGLSVRENLQLGRKAPRRRWFRTIDDRVERTHAIETLASVDLAIDPDTPMAGLGLGEKTLVAVARLFAEEHDVIVLDEVTAALTRRESAWLLSEVRRFTERGGAALVVSHRLNEIAESYDEVTLLRDGSVAFSGPTPELDDLHRLFVGSASPVAATSHPRRAASRSPDGPLLSLRGATSEGVGPVDLEIASGEVVGLVGSLSSNLYEIGHLAAGRATLRSGERRVHASSTDAHGEAVGFLSEERRRLGILPGLDVGDNIAIGALRSFARAGVLRSTARTTAVEAVMERLDIRPKDPSALIEDLSGGNQQKALLGRAMLVSPRLYVLLEPTHGVDVTTRAAIYRFIEETRSGGAGVLVITIDADDVLAVSDRIGFVEDGQITDIHDHDNLTPETILTRIS